VSPYETALDVVECSGWLPWGPYYVTAEPLRDAQTGGYAHLSYRVALEAAAALDARLPTREEVLALFDVALVLQPVILPDNDMIRSAGGASAIGVVAQHLRDTQMTGLEWARIHDTRVREQLDALGWASARIVANAGKHWIAPCPPGRGRLCGWKMGSTLIQAGTVEYGQHNDEHHDYATTTILIHRDFDTRAAS
jgi:hypothetical protein